MTTTATRKLPVLSFEFLGNAVVVWEILTVRSA
jgi:hypothetical protein